MSETIQLRQKNPDETDNMANLESTDDVYGYLSRKVSDQLGEYIAVTLSGDEGTQVPCSGVTGSGSGNYATFDSDGGNIVGFGVHLSILESVLDFEVERDDDGNVLNAPDSIGMQFAASDERSYEQSDEADEEEAEALIVGGGSDDSEEEGGELVEINDEELGLDD